MNKIISAVLALLAIVFFWKVLPTDSFADIAAQIKHPYSASIVEQTGTNRQFLSEDNQQLYDVIKAGLNEMDSEILIQRFAYEEADVQNVLWYIMSDSPELFWVDWSWDVRSQDNGFVIIPHYLIDKSELASKTAELNAAVDALIAKLNETAPENDYQKILFVHDYLIQLCKYNEAGGSDVHNAYGALVQKEAVCDGYAHAAQLIFGRLGIENMYVEGTTTISGADEGHAWNIVNVDGVYCQLDITWDDLDSEKAEEGRYSNIISYNFFLLSDEEMAIDHTLQNKIKTPVCEGYGYFKKLGLVGNLFEDIETNIANVALDNLSNGKYYVEFQIIDADDYNDVCNNYDDIGGVIDSINKTLERNGLYTLETRFTSYRSAERHSLLVIFEQ